MFEDLLAAAKLLEALMLCKSSYKWTPELAQQQADDENTGAYIQPHSWSDTNPNRHEVFEMPVKSLKPTEQLSYPGNVERIAAHVKSGGALPPIYVDAKGKIIDGHHRFAAAKLLKLRTVPVIRRNY